MHDTPRSPRQHLVTIALVAAFAAAASALLTLRVTGGDARVTEEAITAPAAPAASALLEAAPSPKPASVADGTAALAELRDALDRAEAERSQLAAALLELDRREAAMLARLDALEIGVGAASLPTADGAPPADGVEASVDASAETEVPDSLVAAGLDEQSAAEVRRRRDEFELARLELFDRAAREGWLESERLDTELAALENARPDLRDELGDEAYDRYLFEEGERNRVAIASIIGGSAADLAGFEIGDVVIRYAGERVFRTRELQAATRSGVRGETVQVEVRRGDEPLGLSVPRGPLGVTLRGRRLPPG